MSGDSDATADELSRDERIALAVAQLIASRRDGGTVTVVSLAEREDRTNPVVELIASDTVGGLAVEHTLIESFTGQIADRHQIQPYLDALPEHVEHDLPTTSRFDLNLDVRGVAGVKNAQPAIEAIAAWVRRTAPTLPDGRPGINGAHIAKGGPPDLPFEVSLARWPRDEDSPMPRFSLGWWKPEDLEERRRLRISAALDKKLGKLQAASGDGTHGVLVLETDDISLGNAIDTSLALRHETENRHWLPEWIALWETTGDTAFVWLLRENGIWIEQPEWMSHPAL